MKVRKIIAGLVFVSTSLFAIHKCDGLEDLKIYNGHYYGVTSNTFTFDEAKKFATAYNGYLAIPNNAAENNYIKSLIGGRSSAWLGIYDASNSDNYCYTETGCTSTPSRFKDINNTSLSYTNWQVNEPNNYVHSFDVYDGKQMVSPLGEHWVVINGDNGRWYDVGNHIKDNNNPIRHRALIEFNTTPTCYEAPSNITDTFTNSKCNTKLYDTTTDLVENGQTLDCQTDTYNNTYCPSALAECAEQWDYDNGYSVAGIGSVVDYTGRTGGVETVPQVVTSAYALYIEKEYSGLAVGYCIDFTADSIYSCASHGKFFGDGLPTITNTSGYTRILHALAGANSMAPLIGLYKKSVSSCPAGFNLSGGQCVKNTLACPSGYTETTGTETAKGECKKTIEYTYYNYLCNNTKNTQGYNYIPTNSGGNTGKTDPNNTTINDTLDDVLNSSTPPTNNCKREKFTCQANADRPCSFVANKWQCSPFPCINGNDVIPEGSIEGANDKNNDGWSDNGACNGQIYIFNGNDKRCRYKDTFFGLMGGGCCDKDKVFMGLVACKENEKLLAKMNKAEQCHEVGEYCSKKISLGFAKICVQNSKGHCCFGSKLARIIHEQGRPQLGISWGSGESPQCRGFTPEDFQKLDFSKIDLTGAFDIPEIDQSKLNTTITNTIENFKNMLGQ